ncbi:hypothetical protein [Calothrix sp. PCC 6303]|uniref:hypothetical protein n=1 Tax=Calothrix sp. PCC 6303 TaxID=1170562 RepID=UPI0002A01F9E|nr:hypothetical protein [Calothrix sp. PCC 6303]AFZ04648.1 hypothetical protein Cal6303_5786 [Calothrix sp. PCC 6303]
MASYGDWNKALISYFTSGFPCGVRVYLSVDKETLENIGCRFFKQENILGSWANNFLQAVKTEVVINEQVNLNRLRGHNVNGLPKGIAFLAVMVLAANQMAEEEETSERNYFKRLREMLNLKGWGRPAGMNSGSEAEEPLWKEWNRWLMENGFIPSAQQGNGGSMTYINYPITQSLLRRTDKDRLLVLFNEKQWQTQWDAMDLFSQVRREAERLPKHLKELLTNYKERYGAIADIIHEVYQQWQAQGRPNVLNDRISSWNGHIFAGLYRDEDAFWGSVSYYLYPKQVRGQEWATLELQDGDKSHYLSNDRPGWYLPLDFQLGASDLKNGKEYPIVQPKEIKSLILPARDFWILIPDPDNPDAGTYATWGQPSLGTQFILLCKKELLVDIQRLQDEKLIDWNEKVEPFENSNWVELHQCMILSQAWDGVFIQNQALKDALQPSISLSISFSGGLRVAQQNAWLQDHAPQITVFGFYPTVQLQVTSLRDDFLILDKSQSINNPIQIKFPNPGDYLVTATCGSESTQRFIKIVDWISLTLEKPQCCEITPIDSGNNICGSIINPFSKSI